MVLMLPEGLERRSPAPQPGPAALIVNTKARRGSEWLERARECLQRSGITPAPVRAETSAEGLRAAVQKELESGARLLIVGGGDGTIRTAAQQLVHSDSVLGILPLGTVNDFARNLGIE